MKKMNKTTDPLKNIYDYFIYQTKALIPQKMRNEVVLKLLEFLCRKSNVPEEIILKNAVSNQSILYKDINNILYSNGYIENQYEWKDVRFGVWKKSSMQYSGCGIIATYNALRALGETVYGNKMVELISSYEKYGAVLKGSFGVSPIAIENYFRRNGYRVNVLCSKDKNSIDRLGDGSTTVIVTVYNDRKDIMKGMHTVNITKNRHNKYFIHNAYKKNNDVYVSKGNERDGFDTLYDAINNISDAPALLYAIGISK